MVGEILEICQCHAAKLNTAEKYNFNATQIIKSSNTEHDYNYECMTDMCFYSMCKLSIQCTYLLWKLTFCETVRFLQMKL